MAPHHTPGPWFAAEDDSNGQAVVRNKDIEVATCWHHCVGAIEREMRANAQLISAAPDLLTEAAEVCAILDNYNGHDGEALVYDYAAIGEEVARRHQSLTDAIAQAVS